MTASSSSGPAPVLTVTQRVLICGSRTFREGALVEMTMNALTGENVIIHGAAKGADSIAGFHAHRLGFEVEEYPAQWDRYGKRAGYERNVQMLNDGKPDMVFAFVDKPLVESKGTAMMVALAHRAGLPVVVVQYIAPDDARHHTSVSDNERGA